MLILGRSFDTEGGIDEQYKLSSNEIRESIRSHGRRQTKSSIAAGTKHKIFQEKKQEI
jgi:hypothetical protein